MFILFVSLLPLYIENSLKLHFYKSMILLKEQKIFLVESSFRKVGYTSFIVLKVAINNFRKCDLIEKLKRGIRKKGIQEAINSV